MLYGMPKRRLLELRTARVNRLLKEKQDLEALQKEQEREANRQQILNPTA